MFVLMTDGTQAPRDADAPGRLGGANNTARSEVTATDIAQVPRPSQGSATLAAGSSAGGTALAEIFASEFGTFVLAKAVTLHEAVVGTLDLQVSVRPSAPA